MTGKVAQCAIIIIKKTSSKTTNEEILQDE